MALTPIDADSVIREAGIVAKTAMDRISKDVDLLHERGYHRYKTVMMDFRFKIEEGLRELVEQLED